MRDGAEVLLEQRIEKNLEQWRELDELKCLLYGQE